MRCGPSTGKMFSKRILAKLKSDRGSGVDDRTLLSIMFTAWSTLFFREIFGG
jgi:hypothetical protein